MAFDYAVALTGSIATGKSTVSKIFQDFGLVVIDADKIAHEMLHAQKSKIAHLFGENVLSNEGIDRQELGKIVFADSTKRKQLEALLHPLIYAEIERLSREEDKKSKPYLVDIPLFFESTRYPIDKVLVVYTPETLQLSRLMARDDMDEKEALSRIIMQIDIEEKKQKATYVIDNSYDTVHLQEECAKIRDIILGDFYDCD